MCLAFHQKACCGGSLTCCNETCNFQKCYGKENLLQFNKSKNTCSICRSPVEFTPDLAVNIWKFDDSARKMIVMMERQGGEARKRDKEAICTYRRSKQKTAGAIVTRSTKDAIIDLLKEDELCLDNIYNIAVSALEKDKLYYAKINANTAQSHPHGHTFETLSFVRTTLLEKKPFFIYNLNDNNMMESLRLF